MKTLDPQWWEQLKLIELDEKYRDDPTPPIKGHHGIDGTGAGFTLIDTPKLVNGKALMFGEEGRPVSLYLIENGAHFMFIRHTTRPFIGWIGPVTFDSEKDES